MTARLLALLIVFSASLKAQAPGEPNEGSKLEYDATNEIWRFKWWGKAGRTYFLQHSEDLDLWNWVPAIETGNDSVREWGFTSTGGRFFARLQHTDQTAGNPETADFDGDGVANLAELQQGTNPLRNPDTDSDGLPDDWETQAINSGGITDTDGDGDIDLDDLHSQDDLDNDGLSNREEQAAGTSPTNPNSDGDQLDDGEDAYPRDERRWKRVVDQNYALVLLPLPPGATQSWLHAMSDAGSVGGLLRGSAGLAPFVWSSTLGTVPRGIFPDKQTFSFYNGTDPPITADAFFHAGYWRVAATGKAFGSIIDLNLPGTGGSLPVIWTGHEIEHGFNKMWLSGRFSGEIYAVAEPQRIILDGGGRVGVLDLNSVIQAPGEPEYDLNDPEVLLAPNLSELDESAGFGPDAGTSSMDHPLHIGGRPHRLSPSGSYASGLNYVWQVGGTAHAIKNPLPSNRDISQYQVKSLTDYGEAVGDLFAFVTSSSREGLVCHDWRELIPHDFKDQVATPPELNFLSDDEGGRAISPNGSKILANFRHLEQQGVGSWADEQGISIDQFVLQRDDSGTWQLHRTVMPQDYIISTYGITSRGVLYGDARRIRYPDGTPIAYQNQTNRAAILLPIEMKLLWETENKANQIYNATPKDDPWYYEGFGSTGGSNNGASRNRLFLVPDPEDNKYKATLEVEIPEEFRTKFIAAAYVVDTKVANSDTAFDAEGKCALEFEHLGTSEDIQDFAIRIGYDANDSGTLDPGEITKLAVKNFGEPLIRGTKTSKYDSAKSNIDGIISGTLTSIGTDLLLPHAKRFLQIFRQGDTAGVPSDKLPTSSATVSFDAFNGYLSEWLTHNSGAPFDDEGVANITDYTWGPLTSAADLVATSPQIEEPVRDYYNSSVASLATAHFASLPVGSSAYFPSTGFYSIPHTHESPAWVPVSTLTFDSWLPNQGDDVNGTIGRGRLLSHQARYKVEKQENNIGTTANPFYVVELVVVEVLSQGEVIDLYDFNHMVGGAAQDAAILQIGFGKGAYGTARDRGKIYRNRIEFEKTHTSLP